MGKTIAEKIFAAHLRDTPTPENVILDIDVVMCHEITTPIAITDLEARGMDRVFDTSKIKAVITMSRLPRIPRPQPRARSSATGHGVTRF